MITMPDAVRGNEPAGSRAQLWRRTLARLAHGTPGPKSCKDFASQAEAQAYFEAHGGNAHNNVDNLDHNHNGIACEVYPYTQSKGVAGRLRPVAGRVLLPGLFAALGWVAGRQQHRA